MTRIAIRLIVAVVLLAFVVAPLSAQTSKGTIAGTVTDPSGAVVVGAAVSVKNTNGGDVRTTTTGSNGEYRVDAIIPSIYEVTVTQQGFATSKISGVDVRASVVTSLNTQLKPSTAVDTVQVEANSNLLQTETAEISNTVQSVEVTEIPLLTQNPVELALTEPGVVRVSQRDGFTNGVGYSVDGLRPRSNNFLIDGFDNNDNGIAGQAIQNQNTEAVKEVVVLTNSYSAEFGRGGASVTNVITAGGTNSWHGALWERYAGSSFNAIAPEQSGPDVTDVPRVNNNFYGFRLGGPVKKDKLFAFGSAQWNPIRGIEQGGQLIVPTAAGVATLQSIGPNQNAQTLINSLGGLVAPAANEPSIDIGGRPGCAAPCSVEVGLVPRQAPQVADAHEYVFRADYIASERDTLTARWLDSWSSLTPDLFANPFSLPGIDTKQSGPSRNLGVYWTHVINSHAVNEVRFNVQTLDFGFDLTGAALANPVSSLPSIGITGFGNTAFGGVTTGFPQDRNHSVYEYQDSVTYSVGNHSFKFGADLVHLGIEDGVPFNSRGVLGYLPGGDCTAIGLTTGCTALANFIDDFSGQGGNASKQFGVQQVNYPLTQMSFYVQDDWKLKSNLTANLGLRYEYQQQPFNVLPFPAVNERTALTDPLDTVAKVQPDKNNFGPRVGLAYTPRFWQGLFGDNKTVIRAGAGVFYDALFSNILNNNASSTPNVTGGTVVAPTTGRGIANFSQVIPSLTPGALDGLDNVTTVVSNLRNPMTYQWNLNIQRELPGQWFATVAYVGTRGERLFLNEQLNPGITLDSVRENPDRGSIIARSNHGDSIYHGLQLNAEHRFSKGLYFQSAYTWSKSIDNGSEVFTTSGGTTQQQNLLDFRSDRGPSAFDRRHRLVLTWVYSLPSAGTSMLSKVFTNGWQFSGSTAFETGAPETLFLGGVDVNGDASFANDRPSIGNLAVPINYSAACLASPTCNSGIGFSTDGGHSFFDFNTGLTGTAQDFRYIFIQGQNGKIGRNSFNNPGRQDYVMAIQREFKLPMKHLEQQSLQLRLEAFNPFNHPNLGGGENNVSSVSGDINTLNFLNTADTRVGGRQVRLYVKYSF